jgi:hypothetical protein
MESNRAFMEPIALEPSQGPMSGPIAAGSTAPAASGLGESGSFLGMQVPGSVERD